MKQASVEIIHTISEHKNADSLEICHVLGYKCITQKGLYQAGDKIIYIQPDNILPEEPWAEGYRKYAPRRIKAIKLRGEYSEGIIVPLDRLEAVDDSTQEGTEVSSLINLIKYEPPLRDNGAAKAGLPFGLGKTDEERWENLRDDQIPFGEPCDVTLKIDGTSTTFVYNVELDQFNICSRSMTYTDNKENKFAFINERYKIEESLREYCKLNKISLAVRGEVYGSGIRYLKINPHSKMPKDFACFSVYEIRAGYARINNENYFATLCPKLNIPTVPLLEQGVELTPELIQKYSVDLKKLPESATWFEGVVINSANSSFKVINKHYDSKR